MVKKKKKFWVLQLKEFLGSHPFLKIFFSSIYDFFLLKFPKKWKNYYRFKKDFKDSIRTKIFLGELIFFNNGKLFLFLKKKRLEIKEKNSKTIQNIFFLSQKHNFLLSLGTTSFFLDIILFS